MTFFKSLPSLSFFAFLCAAVFAPAWAGPLRLNTDDVEPLASKDNTGLHNRLVIEAGRRIDVDVSVVQLPSERALINANKGIDDGTLPRISGLEKSYPSLVPVDEKFMDYEFVALSSRSDLRLDGWESLSQYSIAYINGWKIFEYNTRAHKNVTLVNTPRQLFYMLKTGRVDLVMYERWQGLQLGKDIGLSSLTTYPLAKKDMFIYLHRSKKHLVNAFSSALREMKKDGTYERIYRESLGGMEASVDKR